MSFPRYSAYKDSGVEWLGEVPQGWEVAPVKAHAKMAGRIGFRGYTTSDIVDEGNGAISLSPSNMSGGELHLTKSTYLSWDKYNESPEIMVCLDDIIMVKTGSTYGKLAIVKAVNYPMTINPQLIIIKAVKCNANFLFRTLTSSQIQALIDVSNTGGSIPTMTQEAIGNFPIAFPPINEQTTIATFLDCETAKIDTLINEQKKLIELLKEKRQAVISTAVTKGLNPHAPMKDSGVEWLGEVPQGWEVKLLRFFADVLRGKFTHRPRNDPAFYDGDFPFIQTGDITGSDKFIIGYKQTLNEKGIAVSKEFPKGTLVMAIAANIGDVAILDFAAYFPDSIVGLVPNQDSNLFFMYYLMIAMKQPMIQTATVSTQMNLSVDQITALKAACPPLIEQQKIVAFLDQETAKIDNLIQQAQKATTLLQERRTALISAAVTGKIDVRGFVTTNTTANCVGK